MAPKPQGQGEMTFQADVGPGDVTGVYYITICNLPFETSWQQLKDWLRPHCEVDHIEVFKTSTSGWVRLRGKRNFDKAWRCLDGGVFHGRSIIASDRNRSEAIKIKELLDFGTSTSRERQRSNNGLLTQPVSPTLYGSPAVANKPVQNSERFHAQCCTGGVPQAGVPMAPAAIVDYTTVPQYVMPSADPTAFARTQAAAAALKPAFQIQYRCNNVANLPTAAQTSSLERALAAATEGESSASASAHEGSLDRCKILLKNLPHRSVAKDIDIWTRRRLGGFEKGLNGVDVPIDDSGVYTRGHAVLRLNSLVDPGWVVKKLHQHTFRGRTVSASKLTDEAAYAKGKYTASSGEQRGGGEDSSDASSGTASSRTRTNGPLVVEGSSRKASGRRH